MATIKEHVELYDGKVSIDFYPVSHSYRKNGVVIDSVTSITGLIDKSKPLMLWAERIAREYVEQVIAEGEELSYQHVETAITLHRAKKQEGADIGTAVHNWIQEWIALSPKKRTSLEMPEDSSVLNGVIAFLSWVNNEKIKFVENERLVYSKKYNYVGKMDNAYYAGKSKELFIGDFKTSNHVGAEAVLQTVGYAIAYAEETGAEVKGLAIQHLSKKDGLLRVYRFDLEKELVEGFIALRRAKTAIKRANQIINNQK